MKLHDQHVRDWRAWHRYHCGPYWAFIMNRELWRKPCGEQ